MADAYVTGLRMLARRELSEAQVRERLARREFDAGDIDTAIARLKESRALDDRRTALACARVEAHIRRHGRLRALRRVESIGVSRELARAAVAEVFGDLDEDALIQQALERRLRHPPSHKASAGQAETMDPALVRRLHRYLLAQGFDASRVYTAIRKRVKNSVHDD